MPNARDGAGDNDMGGSSRTGGAGGVEGVVEVAVVVAAFVADQVDLDDPGPT